MSSRAEPPIASAVGGYVGTELALFAGARHWKAYWSAQLRPLVRGRVLDVGAGLGATARLFAGRAGDVDGDYTALEPDARLAAQMRREAAAGGFPPGFRVLNGTSAELPPGASFDTILYIDVLEHIADDRDELDRAAAHLAADGRVLVLAPAHQWLYSPFDAAVGHVRRYNLASLRAALPPGLVAERMYYLDSVGLLASLGNRLLLRAAAPSAGQIAFWDRWMVPLSTCLDRLFMRRLGKSIVAVLRRRGP